MDIPHFSDFDDLKRFLHVVKSLLDDKSGDNNLDFFTDFFDLLLKYYVHIWTLKAGGECFGERKYFTARRDLFMPDIRQLLDKFLVKLLKHYNAINESAEKSKFLDVYNNKLMFQLVVELDHYISAPIDDIDLQMLLQSLIDNYLTMVAMFGDFDRYVTEILIVTSRIVLKIPNADADGWPRIVKKIITLRMVMKFIGKCLSRKLAGDNNVEDSVFLFVLSLGLESYDEHESERKSNFYTLLAKRISVYMGSFLDLSKDKFYHLHRSTWKYVIDRYVDSDYTNFHRYIDHILNLFSIRTSYQFFCNYILPAIIFKDELAIPQMRDKEKNSYRHIESTIMHVFLDLFFHYKPDIKNILKVLGRFQDICGVDVAYNHIKKFQNVTLIHEVIRRFDENPLCAIKALSFLQNASHNNMNALRDSSMDKLATPKHLTDFLKNNKVAASIIHRSFLTRNPKFFDILFHILRFVDKSKFITNYRFEFLHLFRKILCFRNFTLIPEKSFVYAHILRLLVKHFPMQELKDEATILARFAYTLHGTSPQISHDIYRLLVKVDDREDVHILKSIVLVPEDEELMKKLKVHMKNKGYDYNPFELQIFSQDDVDYSFDDTNFKNICNYLNYLSNNFYHEDEEIQCKSLNDFMDLWEGEEGSFVNYTNHRQNNLEDDTDFVLKFPFPATFKIDKSWKFFRFIILQLLKSVKHSTSRREAACISLGLIGAVSPQNFHLNEPFSRNRYGEDFVAEYPEQLEFSNIAVFRPQTQMFKQMFVMTVVRKMFSSDTCHYKDNVSNSIRLLFKTFQKHRNMSVFWDEPINIDSGQGRLLLSQKIVDYCRKWSDKDIRDEMKILMYSVIKHETNEPLIDLSMLKENERVFLEKEHTSYTFIQDSKNKATKDKLKAFDFFNNIDPKMNYEYFILDFARMIYEEYWFTRVNDPPSFSSSQKNVTKTNIFTQVLTQSTQHEERSRKVEDVVERLRTLDQPQELYEYSYYLATQNVEIAHLLLPSLIIHSLARTNEERQIEFADYFAAMVRKDFMEHHSMFNEQLGWMASQFICFLFDYFEDFLFHREKILDLLVQDQYIRSRAERYDATYAAVKHIKSRLTCLDMARLCIRFKNYTRALYYFEKHYKALEGKLGENLLDIDKNDLMLLLQIFYQLGDWNSLRGISLQMKNFPDVLQRFYFSPNNVDKVGQIQLAESVLNLPNISIPLYMPHRYLVQEFLAKNLSTRVLSQNAFSAFSQQVFREINEQAIDQSMKWSPEVPSLICDAALDLNSWDILDSAFSSPNVKPYTQNRISNVITSLYRGHSTLDELGMQLKAVKSFYIQPLRGELLNSYFNAFEHSYASIVHLHSIYDIHSFINMPYNTILNPNADLAAVLKTFEDMWSHWNLHNKSAPYVYGLNQNRRDIKQQIVRVQVMLKDVFRSLLGKRFDLNIRVVKQFFHRYDFLLYYELMKASVEQNNIEDAHDHCQRALNARNQYYCDAAEGERISVDTTESHFIVDASDIFYRKNNKEGALDLIRKEMNERYLELNKMLANEAFGQMEEKEADYNKINEIALELNLDLQKRYVIHLNNLRIQASKRSNLTSADSSRRSCRAESNVRETEANVFENKLAQLKPTTAENYELLQLQFMMLSEDSGSLSIQSMQFCFDQIRLLKDVPNRNPDSQARGLLQMALYYWRYVSVLQEQQIKSKRDGLSLEEQYKQHQTMFKLRYQLVDTIVSSMRISVRHFKISVPIMLYAWKQMAITESLFKNDTSAKKAYTKLLEECCSKIKTFAEKNNAAVFLNHVELLCGFMSYCKNLQTIFGATAGRILITLIYYFPHQMNWALHRHYQNKHVRDNFNFLFSQARDMAVNCWDKVHVLINDTQGRKREDMRTNFLKCVNNLMDFSLMTSKNSSLKNGTNLLSTHGAALWRQFDKKSYKDYPLMLPFYSCMNLGLYNLSKVHDVEQYYEHLFIDKLKDQFRMMQSIQQPKALTARCRDGLYRQFLLKNDDDLRKDRLFLEFARLFTQALNGELAAFLPLASHSMSSNRGEKMRSAIRFYCVVPLSSQTGIIEWVDNLNSFNSLITREKGVLGQSVAYKVAYLKYDKTVKMNKSAENRLNAFDTILKDSGPVFQNWFINHFANARSWYTARQNYIQSTAAYSALGFMLGLGDRHGENIQFDVTDGHSVHIDFNCLFNLGETFQVPEMVPFRLTQNMLTAMGVTENVGEFTCQMEQNISTMRDYKELLMFLFMPLQSEPLDEWRVLDAGRKSSKNAENTSSRMLETMNRQIKGVRARLEGQTTRSGGQQCGSFLSTSAQTSLIIKQARDKKNLALMFYGWRAFN